MNYPEFPFSPSAKLALGVLHLLKADAPLSRFTEGKILAFELEDLMREGNLSAGTLGVCIHSTVEERSGANRASRLETALLLGLTTAVSDRQGTRDFLRDRVLDHIKALIESTRGEVHYEGEVVSSATLTFERPADARLGPSLLFTPLRVVFEQNIHAETRALRDG